jgi:hypothetical protein
VVQGRGEGETAVLFVTEACDQVLARVHDGAEQHGNACHNTVVDALREQPTLARLCLFKMAIGSIEQRRLLVALGGGGGGSSRGSRSILSVGCHGALQLLVE